MLIFTCNIMLWDIGNICPFVTDGNSERIKMNRYMGACMITTTNLLKY